MSNIYGELNKIAFIKIYSKYKKNNAIKDVSFRNSKNIFMYYHYDLVIEEVDEYFRIKREISKRYLYVFGMYILSLISYSTWIYTIYLYYTGLLVVNYVVLDKMLNRNKLKENENLIRK